MSLLLLSFSGQVHAHEPAQAEISGPYLERVAYLVITQDDQQVLALQDGEIDVIGDMIDPSYVDALTEAENIDIAHVLRNGYGKMVINCAKYPLNITAFRRALAFAVDKEAISNEVWDGLAVPLDSLIPMVNPFSIEGQLGYNYYEENVALGNVLLDEAGFLDVDSDGYREAPDGSDFDILIECAQSSNIAIENGEYFAEALTALGIDAVSEPTDFYEYLNRLYFHGDYDIIFIGSSFNDFDVDWMAYEYHTDNTDEPYRNFPNWSNGTFDEYGEDLLTKTTYEEVYNAAIEMQRIWIYECPEIVCYENILLSAYRTDRFEGFVNDVVEGVPGWWTNYLVHLENGGMGIYGGTLRISNTLDVDTFNFMVTTGYPQKINNALWDSLLRLAPTGETMQWLSEAYIVETNDDNPSVPADHTRFTFDILQNATWTDGSPLTAEDIAFSLNYYRDAPGNPYGVGLQQMIAAYAPSPYRVVVEFDTESFWHLSQIGFKPIIPKDIFQDIGLEGWNLWNPEPSEIVSSGPFTVSDYVAGEFTELSRNGQYFRKPSSTSASSPDLPSISPHIDVTIIYGTSGNQITWYAYDSDPMTYQVYLDSMLYTTGIWDSSSITVDLDGLPLGTHLLQLEVTDADGNIATDIVTVTVVGQDISRIVFDYSHGQYSAVMAELDQEFATNLTSIGYDVVWARGGINESILTGTTGLVIGSIYGESEEFSNNEILAISDWFNSGNRFIWVSYDSDYGGNTYINENSDAILATLDSHVYGEPTAIEDPVQNTGAAYRAVATILGDDPFVYNITMGVDDVLMHGPTCLYGSSSGAPGESAIPLETQSLDNVYPLLYYSPSATITDSDITPPYAHTQGEQGSFLAAALEISAGDAGSGVIITSGASPYGDYRPMTTYDYYNRIMSGHLFVKQAIDFAMKYCVRDLDLSPPSISSPADISYAVGAIGNWIVWTAEDQNPFEYFVYRDDVLVSRGYWNATVESITINVDSLPEGVYEYLVMVTDIGGLSAIDHVIVTVTDLGPGGWILSFFTSVGGLITIGSISVIVVVVVLMLRARNGAPVQGEWVYG
jgi:peptide/nickel transport system substrate-binding protein